MRDGWFEIPGLQRGPRTLEEQLKGLEVALAEAKGKSVLDLGCAEGLIALEFLRAGAASVFGCDCNEGAIEQARTLNAMRPQARFEVLNLHAMIADPAPGQWRADVVLALAILHKTLEPEKAACFAASLAGELLVVRLPGGSKGAIGSKWGRESCDLREVLPRAGLRLEQQVKGPRNELVQYWRRR